MINGAILLHKKRPFQVFREDLGPHMPFTRPVVAVDPNETHSNLQNQRRTLSQLAHMPEPPASGLQTCVGKVADDVKIMDEGKGSTPLHQRLF